MKRTLNVATMVLLVGAGFACTRPADRAAADRDRDNDRTAMAKPSPTATPLDTEKRDTTPSAGDITSNPALYSGQQVTLKSNVKKIMPHGFFTLKDKDLLVLSPSGQPMEDQEVTVHGTVQTYSAPEFKKRYNWFRSNSRVDSEYKDRAVIVADSILTAEGRDVVSDHSGANLPASSGEPRRRR